MALNSTFEAPSGMSRSGGKVGVVGITIIVPGFARACRRFLASERMSSPLFASFRVTREAISKRSLIAGDIHMLRLRQCAPDPVEHSPDRRIDARLATRDHVLGDDQAL